MSIVRTELTCRQTKRLLAEGGGTASAELILKAPERHFYPQVALGGFGELLDPFFFTTFVFGHKDEPKTQHPLLPLKQFSPPEACQGLVGSLEEEGHGQHGGALIPTVV